MMKGFFEKLNKIHLHYQNRSFEFDNEFNKFTDEVVDYLNSQGDSSKVSEILRAKNMVSTVKKGFDPIRMEKITRDRRKLLWSFSFHALENIQDILQEIYQKQLQKIEKGEEIISKIVVTLYQNKLLDNDKIRELDSISKIEFFWGQLIDQNESISVIDKKLRLELIAQDIYLILERNLTNVK